MDNLATIKSWSKEYNNGSEPLPLTHEGMTYYVVGHNASHQFALGVDSEGYVWKYSCGEGAWDEATESYGLDVFTRKVGELLDVGYIGHW